MENLQSSQLINWVKVIVPNTGEEYYIPQEGSITLQNTLVSSAITASYALSGGSGGGGTTNTSSLLTTASFSNPNLTFEKGDKNTFNVNLSTLTVTSASYAVTASYILNSISSSFASTASYVLNAISSSRSITASYAIQALSASYAPFSPVFPYTGSARITGSLDVIGSQVITGSLRGQISTLSIVSNTASVNLSTNNFFTLTLVNGANTHINPTNINPGQTVNIRVTQGNAGTGTVSFPSFVDQSSGSLYTGSAVANAVDIVTMITFDSSIVYISSIRNMI
jgi:hypothetical protein